jgi:hypothetical protein
MPLLAATPMSRTTLSTRAGQKSLLPPQAPTVVMGSPSSSSTPIPSSVQMGSPTPIASAGDLTPMQVDAVLLFHPNPLVSCTFGKRRLLGLFKMSTTELSHLVIVVGNPWVFLSNPYPYGMGMGFGGYGYGFLWVWWVLWVCLPMQINILILSNNYAYMSKIRPRQGLHIPHSIIFLFCLVIERK